jgi:hypothetical protein
MPEYQTAPDKSESLMPIKLTIWMLVPVLAILLMSGTMAYTQTAQPEPKPQVSSTANSQGNTSDADKMRVQARWDSSSETPSPKASKTDKPGKQEAPKPSDDRQQTGGTEPK